MKELTLIVAAASVAAALLSLSVAVFLAVNEKFSNKLIKYGTPFAAGVLLMAAFWDLLPEGIAEAGTDVVYATLGGIILFFLIEKGFQSFHHHHEEDADKPKDTTQGWLFLVGDVFHNLVDGISLGGAFLIGGRDTGLIATLALVAHDIPLEVGEFGNQLRVGFTKRQTIIRNIISGISTVIFAVLTYQLGDQLLNVVPIGYLYGGIAGFFIYIALSDIIPTIHQSEKSRYGLQTGFLIFGLIFGGTVAAVAHDYIDVGHNHDHEHEGKGHDDHDEEGHDEHAGHDHGAYDPHFWFDPNRVAYAAEYIESKLVEFDPSNASEYEAAGKAYVTELKGLVGQVSELISTIPSQNRKLITTHESLGYLEAKFGLEVLSTIIPSLDSANEISPSQLTGVIDVIEDNNVKVIFIESEAPSVYAETIVAETGIKAVEGLWVETLKEGQSYPEFLLDAVELIVENLRNTD